MFASQETYVPSAHLEGGVAAATDYAVNQGMYSVAGYVFSARPPPLPLLILGKKTRNGRREKSRQGK